MSAAEPLDPKRPRGGMRFAKSELLEMSVVSVPADPDAGVVARSYGSRTAFMRLIDGLPPVNNASMARATAIVPQRNCGRILSHAGHVWTLLYGSAQRYSRETRLAELRERRNRYAH